MYKTKKSKLYAVYIHLKCMWFECLVFTTDIDHQVAQKRTKFEKQLHSAKKSKIQTLNTNNNLNRIRERYNKVKSGILSR